MQKWIMISILSFVAKLSAIAKNVITIMMLLFVKVVGMNKYNDYLNGGNLKQSSPTLFLRAGFI